MTTEQCIEIAKLWGWERNGGGYWVNPAEGFGRKIYNDRELRNEIHSWQGFGRTVEAMSDKGWCFCDSSSTGICFYKPYEDDIPIDVEFGCENPKSLITATHLAALEALKDG